MTDPITEKVLAAVASVKHIERERVSPDSSLEELGFDSLDATVLLFELEKQFETTISDEEFRTVRSVRDIVEEVSRLAANPGPDSGLDPVPPEAKE